jgi:hypothetical protein
MVKKLAVAVLALALGIYGVNLYTLTGDILLDGYSDYTVWAYDFGSIKGSFAHTYLRDNNIYFLGCKTLGTLKPFVEAYYIPGGSSAPLDDYNSTTFDGIPGVGDSNTTTIEETYTDVTDTKFNTMIRMGLGLDMGAMKFGIALRPIFNKNNEAFNYSYKRNETQPPSTITSPYFNETRTADYASNLNAGGFAVELGGDLGFFGFDVDVGLSGVENEQTFELSQSTTTYTWNFGTAVYDPTITSSTVSVTGVDPSRAASPTGYADATNEPDAMTTVVGNLNIPVSGYSNIGVGLVGYVAGMKDALGIIYAGVGLDMRSYDPTSSSWIGQSTAAGATTTARLTNNWDVTAYNNLNIFAALKKTSELTDKLTFGLYPRVDFWRYARAAEFTLTDETVPGTIVQGDRATYDYSSLSYGLGMPLTLKHQTTDNLAMYFTIKPAVVWNHSTAISTSNNSGLTSTTAGTSVSFPLDKDSTTAKTVLGTNYGADFAYAGFNWYLSDALFLGAFASASAASLNISAIYANITYMFGGASSSAGSSSSTPAYEPPPTDATTPVYETPPATEESAPIYE